MEKLRQALLFLTAPLWLGPYLALGLARLCGDGLAFVVEEYTGFSLPEGRVGRFLLGVPALVLFPLAITAETFGIFLVFAGALPPFLVLHGALTGLGVAAAGALTWGTTWLLPSTCLTAVVLLTLLGVGWFHRPSAPSSHALAVILVSVLVVMGFASMQILPGSEDQSPFSWAGPGLGIGMGLGILSLLTGSRWRERIYLAASPVRVLSRAAHAFLGLLTVLLSPLWIPYFLILWLLRELLLGVVIRDVRARATIPSSALLPSIPGASGRRFESFVGLRYLRGRKDQGYLSAITFISILGVTVGVWALNVVLSVMGGFERDLRDKILGANAHVVVLSHAGDIGDYREVGKNLAAIPGITATTPFVYTELILKNHDEISGAILKGIDAESVEGVTTLVKDLNRGMEGDLKDIAAKRALLKALDEPVAGPKGQVIPDPDSAAPGILVGEELARILHLYPGDVLTAISPVGGEPGPFGAMTNPLMRLRVKGVFKSGMYEYDTRWSYVSLKTAQRFLRKPDAVTAFEVRVADIDRADEIAAAAEARLGYPYWAQDWMALNHNLFAALKMEKVAMGIILTFIVMVAALNIISTLIMVVIEKGKEIAILKAMGAPGVRIMKVFMIEGLIIGFIGTTTGTLLGWLSCLALDRYKFIKLDTDVYYLDTLPVEISPLLFAVVAGVAMAVSFGATIYPSWQASNIDPVDGLRYE